MRRSSFGFFFLDVIHQSLIKLRLLSQSLEVLVFINDSLIFLSSYGSYYDFFLFLLLKVVASGIWVAPGDSEEISVAFSQSLRNCIERFIFLSSSEIMELRYLIFKLFDIATER